MMVSHTACSEIESPYTDDERLWLNGYRHNPLLQAQPLLLLLIQHTAEKHHWPVKQRLAICQSTTVDSILPAIGLPITARSVWVLQQVNALSSQFELVQYALSELAKLYRCFANGSLERVAVSAIPRQTETFMLLAALLAKFPTLADARFVTRSVHTHLCFDLATFKVTKIQDAAKRLGLADIDKKLRRCRHFKDLNLLLQRLDNQLSDTLISALQSVPIDDLWAVVEICEPYLTTCECHALERHWFDRYEPVGLVDNDSIIQLGSYQALFLESHQQHNCTSTYQSDAQTGEYVLFKVLAPERATLGLIWQPKKQRYRFDQLVLKNNQPVATETRRAVKRWLKQAQQTFKPPAIPSC